MKAVCADYWFKEIRGRRKCCSTVLEKKVQKDWFFSMGMDLLGGAQSWPLFPLLVSHTFVITQIALAHLNPMASVQRSVVCTESINSSNAMAGASPPMAKICLCCVNHGSCMAPQGSQLQPFPASHPGNTYPVRGESSLHTEVVSTHEPVLSEWEIIYHKITA